MVRPGHRVHYLIGMSRQIRCGMAYRQQAVAPDEHRADTRRIQPRGVPGDGRQGTDDGGRTTGDGRQGTDDRGRTAGGRRPGRPTLGERTLGERTLGGQTPGDADGNPGEIKMMKWIFSN